MVTLDSEFYKMFGNLVGAISPYLDEIVFIGGVANALYEFHPEAQSSGNPNLMTKDVDLATAMSLSRQRKTDSLAILLERAGFKVDEQELMEKKLTKFRLLNEKGQTDNSYEIEFLCPFTGRDPGPDFIEVQKGISSIPLRFMDLPLVNPWQLSLSRLPGLQDRNEGILIPNPGTYIVQKFITMFRRTRESAMQKDAYYIYEFCLKFRDSLPLLNECIDGVVKAGFYKDVKNFRKDFEVHFSRPESKGVMRIVREANRLPFGEGQSPPDNITVHAVIQRLVDVWKK